MKKERIENTFLITVVAFIGAIVSKYIDRAIGDPLFFFVLFAFIGIVSYFELGFR